MCSLVKSVFNNFLQRCSFAPSLSPHPTRNSSRSIRSSLLRSDVKRHTYTGKRTIQRSMISSPQGDVKHTGHVGLDGAYFGDLSFLDSAGCVSIQQRANNILNADCSCINYVHVLTIFLRDFARLVKQYLLKHVHICHKTYSKCPVTVVTVTVSESNSNQSKQP